MTFDTLIVGADPPAAQRRNAWPATVRKLFWFTARRRTSATASLFPERPRVL